MFLTNFGLKYPELAEKETRIITLLSDKEKVPKGEYVIQEMYCTDIECDCRKVSFNVVGPKKEIYYFDYGFEKPEYYMKWGIGDLDTAKEMSGLSANLFNGNFKESELFFDTIEWVLNDEKYIDRLKKHYFLMKENVEGYEDPFLNEDNEIYLGNDEKLFIDKELNSESNNIIKNKKLKEKGKKKAVKKQKQKLRKKKKK